MILSDFDNAIPLKSRYNNADGKAVTKRMFLPIAADNSPLSNKCTPVDIPHPAQ